MKNLRLFISTDIPDSTFKRSKCVRLLHPRLGTKCVFIASEDFNDIYELQKISLPGRSLIYDNRISECGDVYIPARMSVIFLFIPSLLKMDKFTTLDVLVRSECAPGFSAFFPESTFDKLCTICESKVTCGLKVLRLCDEKLMDWLNDTFNQICEAAHRISDYRQMCQLRAILAPSNGNFHAAALPPGDSSAVASNDLDSSALKNLAFQIIADKLPYQLVDKLFSSLGLVALPAEEKENEHNEESGKLKVSRSAVNYGNPTEDYMASGTAVKAVMAKSAAHSKRMKMAKGTKSIMSFFSKT